MYSAVQRKRRKTRVNLRRRSEQLRLVFRRSISYKVLGNFIFYFFYFFSPSTILNINPPLELKPTQSLILESYDLVYQRV